MRNNTRVMARRVESFSPLRLGAPSVAFALPFPLNADASFLTRLFTLAPDGKRIIVVQPDERQPASLNSLQVIRNWSTEVMAKLAGK